MEEDQVKILCKRTVVSTKPVERGKSCSFSVLDHAMDQNHVRMVYYYGCGGRGEKMAMTKRLRESLAETLTSFPVMTGRLVMEEDMKKWVVRCNDAGVRVLEAKAKGSIEEWLMFVDLEKERKLVYWEEMDHRTYFWSTFYVQLTEFEEGGMAIGLSCTHLLADPICASMFIKAWADTTLTGTMSYPPLFNPLPPLNSELKPYNHLYKFINFEGSPPLSANPPTATVSLLFTDPMVCACWAAAWHGSSCGKSVVQPFEALAGLCWVCVSKAAGVGDGLMDMSIGLDVREILGLGKGYFGNCMTFNKVRLNQNPTAENKLLDAVRRIDDTMGEIDYEGTMDLIEWLRRNDNDQKQLLNGSDLICVDLGSSVDPNRLVFEEGFDPIRVSCHVEGPSYGSRRVMILPSPSGEGPMCRVVAVTLPADEMVKVLEDDLLRSFSPIVLMGMNI